MKTSDDENGIDAKTQVNMYTVSCFLLADVTLVTVIYSSTIVQILLSG